MSFIDQFKALLEELVLPEVQSVKAELSETTDKFNSIEAGINDLSESIPKLEENLNEGFTRLGDKIDKA